MIEYNEIIKDLGTLEIKEHMQTQFDMWMDIKSCVEHPNNYGINDNMNITSNILKDIIETMNDNNNFNPLSVPQTGFVKFVYSKASYSKK